MNLRLRAISRALRREVSPAWFALPALLLVALLGAVLLAGVLKELPARSGPDSVETASPVPAGSGA